MSVATSAASKPIARHRSEFAWICCTNPALWRASGRSARTLAEVILHIGRSERPMSPQIPYRSNAASSADNEADVSQERQARTRTWATSTRCAATAAGRSICLVNSLVNFLTDAITAAVKASARRVPKDKPLLIKSPAGEFPITIERFEVEGRDLVIVGKMGVWDARTHVGPRDFLRVLGKLFLSPAVLFYAVKAPFAAAGEKSN